jgi:glycosyltransferase involved in cell wall biosynthesis
MLKSGPSSTSNSTHHKVVAAFPCFDTQRSIAGVVSAAKKYVDEVVVIDDGSTDKTAQIANLAGATVISHGVNEGYGKAITSCFAAARARDADVLVIMDGDGQHDPGEIPDLLAPIINGNADLVIGSRFLQSRGKIPGYRKFGIEFINWLWNLASRIKVSDTQSGARGYSKNIINSMEFSERGMGISIEILEIARRSNARIKEVPISCSYENNNSSLSIKALSHGMDVVFSVIRIRLKTRFAREKPDQGLSKWLQ